MSCGKYTAEYWRSQIDAQGSDLNATDRLVAWEREESDGCPGALGSRYEVGIFQCNLQDGPKYGGTLDTLHGDFTASPTSQQLTRELTPDEESLQVSAGLDMVREARSIVLGHLDTLGLTWADDDQWCLTKLYHALPALTRLSDQAGYLGAAAAAGAAGSWSDFKAYLLGLSQSDAAAVNSAVANNSNYYRSDGFAAFVRNAERVGYAGGVSDTVGSVTDSLGAELGQVLGDNSDGSTVVEVLLVLAAIAAIWFATR